MNTEYTEHLILKLCTQPRSLDYITNRLQGVDPVAAFHLMLDLERRELLRNTDGLWLLEEKSRQEFSDLLSLNPQLYLKSYMGDFDVFKKPHPLDFEWRNTKKSVDYLSDIVLQSTRIEDNILILGMPTLFADLCRRDIPQSVTIVERNKGVINTLKEISNSSCKVIEKDIFSAEPDKIGLFATVVMDPPWYEPHFYQFIWLASQCLHLGGTLIISIPPINTRPGIDKERIKWFTFCQEQGLCLESLLAGRLEYAMPFFEWNANRSAGVSVNPFWRKGDLAIFQKLNRQSVIRPVHTEDTGFWHEVEYNNCRIRVKIEDTDEVKDQAIEIIPLVKNQILDTVSRRNPIRERANIWTSGNRIFETNAPKQVYMTLKYMEENIPDHSKNATTIFDFVQLISGFENTEYNDYLEWFYHEMEGSA